MRKSFCPIRSSRLLHGIHLFAAGNDRQYYLYHLATNSTSFSYFPLAFMNCPFETWMGHVLSLRFRLPVSHTYSCGCYQTVFFIRFGISIKIEATKWKCFPVLAYWLTHCTMHATNWPLSILWRVAASFGNADHKNMPFSLPAPFLFTTSRSPSFIRQTAFFFFHKNFIETLSPCTTFFKGFSNEISLTSADYDIFPFSSIYIDDGGVKPILIMATENVIRLNILYFFPKIISLSTSDPRFMSKKMRKKAVKENGQKSDRMRKRRWQK